MAQILKTDVKNRIISSAKNEFLKKGLKNSSLRNIAKDANITVGNLYRYFKNKDDIINTIVNPTLNELNEIVKRLTDEKINFEKRIESFNLSVDNIRAIFDKLSYELALLNIKYNDEMKILIKYSEKSLFLKEWLYELIIIIIQEKNASHYYSDEFVNVYARSLCSSIFAGFSECLLSDKMSFDETKKLIKTYFDSFVVMLQMDYLI